MRTYIASFIPKYKQFSQKLDNEALLMNQHWVMVDDSTNTKTVYIFKDDNRLLLSTNGKVNQARWEMIDSDHVLLSVGDESYMFKHGFLSAGILALRLDGSAEYALFYNSSNSLVPTLSNANQIGLYLSGQTNSKPPTQSPSPHDQPKTLNDYLILIVFVPAVIVILALILGYSSRY